MEEITVLNLENLHWITIDLMKNAIIERAEHSTAVSEDQTKIYIFGGVKGDFLLSHKI